MLRTIGLYGLIGGVIAGVLLSAMTLGMRDTMLEQYGVAIGYASMLVALSTIFVAVKRRRDRDLGGVITFWEALGIGVGISVIASILYALSWEISMQFMSGNFAQQWADAVVADARAKGASAAEIARLSAEMAAFQAQYANPLYRLAMSFTEIFPVGVLVSLVTAGLLRNRRFLPARPATA